jgi:hypothetical protein
MLPKAPSAEFERVSLVQAGRIFGWTGSDAATRRNTYRIFCATPEQREALEYSTLAGAASVRLSKFLMAAEAERARRVTAGSRARFLGAFATKGAPPPSMRKRTRRE